ncbi:hypothetical protein QF046_003029 [Microbacterium sp. W4I4]|nr:hypothetical protein [Microbacterium sp. W4I4]
MMAPASSVMRYRVPMITRWYAYFESALEGPALI